MMFSKMMMMMLPMMAMATDLELSTGEEPLLKFDVSKLSKEQNARMLQTQSAQDWIAFYFAYAYAGPAVCWEWSACATCTPSQKIETQYGQVQLTDLDASVLSGTVDINVYWADGSPTLCSDTSTYITGGTFTWRPNGIQIFGIGIDVNSSIAFNIHRNTADANDHTMWFHHDAANYAFCSFYAADASGNEYPIIDDVPVGLGASGVPYLCSDFQLWTTIGVRCGLASATYDIVLEDICEDSSFEFVAHGDADDPATYPLTLMYVPGRRCDLEHSCSANTTVPPSPPVYNTTDSCNSTAATLAFCESFINTYAS